MTDKTVLNNDLVQRFKRRKYDITNCLSHTYYLSLPKWVKVLRQVYNRIDNVKWYFEFKQRQLDFKWKKFRGYDFGNTEQTNGTEGKDHE